jgi:hypothetical protein
MSAIKTYESFEVEAENEEIAIARGKQLFLNAMRWNDGDQDISFYNIEEIKS